MRSIVLRGFGIFIIITHFANDVLAQPFLELASFQHYFYRNSGIGSENTNTKVEGEWSYANSSLPVKIDSTNLLLLSPAYEYRRIHSEGNREQFYQTISLPVTWLHTLRSGKNKFSITGIYRFNVDTREPFNSNNDQIGVAALFYHRHSKNILWKGGLYVNQEFFHTQYIPLLGVEAHLSKRMMLWALLPRNLFVDYSITPALHTGFAFKGLDESYRVIGNATRDFYRLREGNVRIYFDYYIPHSLLSLTLSGGHSLQRKYTYKKEGILIKEIPEGAYSVQVGIALRIVTDPLFTIRHIP